MNVSSRSNRILLIDDDRVDRTRIRRHLWAGPIDTELVEEATLGAALKRLSTDLSWTCILVDWHLPGGDGRAVVESVAERSPGIPLIVVSGSESVLDREAGLRAGAHVWLRKRALDAGALYDALDEARVRAEHRAEDRRRWRAQQAADARTAVLATLEAARTRLAEAVLRLGSDEAEGHEFAESVCWLKVPTAEEPADTMLSASLGERACSDWGTAVVAPTQWAHLIRALFHGDVVALAQTDVAGRQATGSFGESSPSASRVLVLAGPPRNPELGKLGEALMEWFCQCNDARIDLFVSDRLRVVRFELKPTQRREARRRSGLFHLRHVISSPLGTET